MSQPKQPRPNIDEVMLAIACIWSLRGTCRKRQVGCVLADAPGNVLASGYNGVPRGIQHCIDIDCGGGLSPSGSDMCQAVHAEMNALMMCHDISKIHTCYVTCVPCNHCLKLLLNTPCQQLVIATGSQDDPALVRWRIAGRTVVFGQ